MKHFLSAVTVLALVATASLDVQAQASYPRADSGPFGNIRVGLSSYAGDRDADEGSSVFKPQFGDAGFAVGFEAGMILSPAFSLSIGYQWGKYDALANNPPHANETNELFPVLDPTTSTNRGTIPLLLRWMIIPKSSVSPYLNLGGNLTLGSHKLPAGSSTMEMAYGPSFGLGFDFVVSRHNSLFLEATYHLTFNDFKVDAADGTPEVTVRSSPRSRTTTPPSTRSASGVLGFAIA